MRTYKTLMERVTVTEDMRARILRTVRQGGRPSAMGRWKTWLPLAACLVLVAASLAVVPLLRQSAERPGVQVVSEMIPCGSLAELEATVGFSVEVPEDLPFAAETVTYTAFGQEMAQVTCQGEEQSAVLRKSVGSGDNSGDYTAYAETAVLAVNAVEVTLKGDGEIYVLALWTDGGYAYSLRVSPGCGEAAWTAMLESLISGSRNGERALGHAPF